MLEPNFDYTIANSSDSRLDDLPTNSSVISCLPQIRISHKKTNTDYTFVDPNSINHNFRNGSNLTVPIVIHKIQDEKDTSRVRHNMLNTSEELESSYLDMFQLKRRKYQRHPLNIKKKENSRENSRIHNKQPPSEISKNTEESIFDPQADKIFYGVLGELKKYNKINFDKILERKALNQTKEKQITILINNNSYRPKIKPNQKKPENKLSNSIVIKDPILLRPKPIIKEKLKYSINDYLVPQMNFLSPDLSFRSTSKSENKRVSVQGLGEENPLDSFNYELIESQTPSRELQIQSGIEEKLNALQDLSRIPRRAMKDYINKNNDNQTMPNNNAASHKSSRITSRTRISANFNRGFRRYELLNQSYDDKARLKETLCFLDSTRNEACSPENFDYNSQADKNNQLLQEKEIKMKNLKNREMKYRSLLNTHIETNFGKLKEKLQKYQELKQKNDHIIAQIRKHY